MAIQSRRGNIANFDANKMLPGEFACALDTGELFYCVSPGNVKRCATKEELQQILASTPEAYTALQELIANLQNQTVLTGILNDISNLKSTKLALTGDSKANTTTFVEASTLANINSAETHATLFGKIKKFFSFVGTTTLTTTAQTISAATNEILAANRSGWSAILATDKLTYKSASAPTFICNTLNSSNVAKDMRPYLSVGMKLKITQDAVVKYFFITAIDATSITLYGGTDYVLTTTAVTNVCYSVVKSPHGFPMNPNKWSVTTIVTTDITLSVVGNVWKDTGVALSLPVGDWDISAKYTLSATNIGSMYGAVVWNCFYSSPSSDIILATSIASDTTTDPSCSGTSTIFDSVRLEVPTVFRLYVKCMVNSTTVYLSSSGGRSIFKATCAYL